MKNNNLYFNSDSLNQSAGEDFERACKTLEFDKVLSILSSFAATEGAKEKIMLLRPSVSIEKIRDWQSEVSEANLYIETKGTPSFGGAKDGRRGYMLLTDPSPLRRMQAEEKSLMPHID